MQKKQIILLIILLLFTIGLFLATTLFKLQNESSSDFFNKDSNVDSLDNFVNVSIVDTADATTVSEVITKYKSKYLSEESRKIYVEFAYNLYDANGNSNENYFKNLTNDLKRFYTPKRFYLIDSAKNITIDMSFDEKKDEYIMKINGQDNYYNITNGQDFNAVDTIKITKGKNLFTNNELLDILTLKGPYINKIEDRLGEGKDLKNGYISYLENTVRIKILPSKSIKNIIFYNNYEGSISNKINYGMTLREIIEAEPEYQFGDLSKGYIGYRDSRYYIFCYKDEISVYPYTYEYNKVIKELIVNYIETKDLKELFIKLENYGICEELEYDKETESLKALISGRGIEIDIKNNDSTGITLYNNFYFMDEIKQYVKNGLISLNSEEDLIDKTERERRDNYNN